MSAGRYASFALPLILAISSGCNTRDRVPPAPGMKDMERDAAVDYGGGGSSAADGGGSGAGGASGTAGSGGSTATAGSDSAGGAGGSVPQHVSESCDDFSTGTVHLLGETSSANRVVMEVTIDETQKRVCGTLPDDVPRPWIRQTDGKMLYLSRGNVHQFVPDPPGTDPVSNDPIVDVANSCGPSPNEGHGPFARMLLKPNGGVVFACSAESEADQQIYDDLGQIFGNWADGTSLNVVDNNGVFLNLTRGPFEAEKNWLYTYTRRNNGIALRPVDRDADCYDGSRMIAVRAQDSGFWVVLVNSCGLQLWQVLDTKIQIIAYYLHDPNEKYQATEPGFGNLAADGTLYYKQICTTNIDCLPCDGEVCAVRPSNEPRSTVESVPAYPVSTTPTVSSAMLLETWSYPWQGL